MFWERVANLLRQMKCFFKRTLFSGTPETLQAKQNREYELDKLRRDSAIIFEKISRRI